MDWFTPWLSIANAVALIIAFLFLRNYLPSYLGEKGKNLATKEDIEEITRKIEAVRNQYAADIERLKSVLEQEGKLLEERRGIYARIVESLRIFTEGQKVNDEKKDEFLASYAGAWLWAPDSVIESLTRFLDLQIQYASRSGSVSQDDMKAAYADVLLEMRRDVGFAHTKVQAGSYRFVRF